MRFPRPFRGLLDDRRKGGSGYVRKGRWPGELALDFLFLEPLNNKKYESVD